MQPDVRGLELTKDEWLSAVLERPVYRVGVGRASNDADSVVDSSFFYVRIPVDEIDLMADFTARGFDLVEVAVRLSLDPSLDSANIGSRPIQVRKAVARDATRVSDIARRSLSHSRFHADPRIGELGAARVKSEWASNLCTGRRGLGCWVAHIDGQVIGFVGVAGHTAPGPAMIDLIAVDPAHQGIGAGAALVHQVRRWAIDKGVPVVTGTQITNASAIRFYECCGFRFSDASFVLHAHAGAGGQPGNDVN